MQLKIVCENCNSPNTVQSVFWLGVIDCTNCGKTLHNKQDEKKRAENEGVKEKPSKLFDDDDD